MEQTVRSRTYVAVPSGTVLSGMIHSPLSFFQPRPIMNSKLRWRCKGVAIPDPQTNPKPNQDMHKTSEAHTH